MLRVLLPCLLLAACGQAPSPPKQQAFRLPVLVGTVEERELSAEVRVGGSLDPAELVQITNRVAGVVERVDFSEGAAVSAGQVLMAIEPDRFRIAAERAAAAVAKAEAQVVEARASLKRREDLAARGSDLVPAEELAAWSSRLAQAEAEAALARAGLAQAELDARDCHVRAPIAGIIETRSVRLGQFLPVGSVIATQVRRLPLRLRAQVPTADAGLLTVGQAVRAEADGRSLTGVLVLVGSSADAATRTVPVVAEFAEAPTEVVAGAFAMLRATTGGGQRLVVPTAAVRAGERGWATFVVEGTGDDLAAVRRQVETGLRADGMVEIRAGLAAGERVVLRGADALRDGQAVRIESP